MRSPREDDAPIARWCPLWLRQRKGQKLASSHGRRAGIDAELDGRCSILDSQLSRQLRRRNTLLISREPPPIAAISYAGHRCLWRTELLDGHAESFRHLRRQRCEAFALVLARVVSILVEEAQQWTDSAAASLRLRSGSHGH